MNTLILIYHSIPLDYLYTTLKTDDVKEMIRNFILENDGKVTKNDVIRHMINDSSRAPTLDMINELESAGIIEVSRGNRRGQPHYLRINNKNDYNRISKELSKLEKLVNSMDEPIKRIRSLGHPEMIKKNPDRMIIRSLHDNFLSEYHDSIDDILDALLGFTINKVHSEKESWSLYTRIIKLKIKMNEQMTIFKANGIEHLFLSCKALLGASLHKLKSFGQYDLDFAKEYGINNRPIADVIEKIENGPLADVIEKIETFKNEFL
jgi:hypothetical protein